MSLFERQVAGVVILPPREEQLSPRQLDRGGRNVPRTSLRLRNDQGTILGVTFSGEMIGQVSQGDYLVCHGYSRRNHGFVATRIWLRGALDERGELYGVDEPVLIADKKVCAIASTVFGPTSTEVADLRRFRTGVLARSRIGRGLITCYGWVGPWLAVRVLDRSARLRGVVRTLLRLVLRHLPKHN